jgi:hypothetical protein
MKFELALVLAAALSVAAAGDALAYSSSSKSTFKGSHLCSDKVAAKGLKGKEYKAEKAKCMDNPTDYQ